MKALTICSALLLAVPTAVPTAAPIPKGAQSANLIANGSFEDVKDDEASRPQNKGSAAITGWVVTRGQIDVTQENGNDWKAHHGKRALDLHGSPGFGGVEQSITTKPGKKYKVTFKMSGNPGVPEHKKVQLGVRGGSGQGVRADDGGADLPGPQVAGADLGVYRQGEGDRHRVSYRDARHLQRVRRAASGRRQGR
jgi:hypothetical protein